MKNKHSFLPSFHKVNCSSDMKMTKMTITNKKSLLLLLWNNNKKNKNKDKNNNNKNYDNDIDNNKKYRRSEDHADCALKL